MAVSNESAPAATNADLGRLALAAGDAGAAAEHFTHGTITNPDAPANWIGLARALFHLGNRNEAGLAAERFTAFDIRPDSEEDLAAIATIADALFDHGERQLITSLYAAFAKYGHLTGKITDRLANGLLRRGDATGALAIIEAAEQQGKLDKWARKARAYAKSQLGQHDEAIGLAETLLRENPSGPAFIGTYLDTLARARDPIHWQNALERFGAILPPEGVAELHARIASVTGDIEHAASVLAAIQIRPQSRLYYAALEMGYAALGAGKMGVATSLALRLRAISPEELGPAILTVDISLRQQLAEEAATRLRALPPEMQAQPAVKMKWLEYYSFSGHVAEADEVLDTLDGMGNHTKQHILAVLRFLAEQQRWNAVVDRSLAWLDTHFRFEQVGYLLFRAAKHTGRHQDFLTRIEAISLWRETRDLARLHTALVLDRAGTAMDLDQLELMAGETLPYAVRHRLAIQREMLSRARPAGGRRAIFLCTNASYLCATLVALHSALSRSAPSREDAFIVVDDNIADIAGRFVKPYRDRGFVVDIVPASQVVDNAAKLRENYGLFTSGHVLALAAYYRIFFARHLLQTGRYSQALYLDGDVLVRTELDRLFNADLAGHPLGARNELPRAEVTRAIALHGLKDDFYFNSGVLVFDLTHPDIGIALDQSIIAAVDEGTTLLYHDQCALNLGFRDRCQPLPLAWNTPVVETIGIGNFPAETGVLHYLDRPKPWSAAYIGDGAIPWFDEWQSMAAVIGEAAAIEALALAED